MKYRNLAIALLLFVSISGRAQDAFKVYYLEKEDGFEIVADNKEYCPVSVEIDFSISNLSSEIENKSILQVPALSTAYHLADLKVIDRKKSIKVGYSVRYNLGNHLQEDYDKDYPYNLPYEKGKSYMVTQGYFGKTSHHDEYALDFKMPEGTKITAARDGVVVEIQEEYDSACTQPECAKKNNYILVYHQDGTFAEYTHIKKKGAIVEEGDKILKDQVIGYSGNVGWSTGPHLHFIVFLQRFKTRETLPVKFRVQDGSEKIALKEREFYPKRYD